MKFLFDFFPVLLFFIVFKVAGIYPDTAQMIAQSLLGGMVAHGSIDGRQAPVLLGVLVTIIASAFQISYLLLTGKKIDAILWISAFLVTFLGGLTIYFNDENFVRWKPTAVYWSSGFIFAISQFFFKKNPIRDVLEKEFKLPEEVWGQLIWAWIGFFFSAGLITLIFAFVIYKGPDQFSSFVTFKTFVMPVIMLVFVIGQGLFLSKHIEHIEEKGEVK
jgi:intracellular septation protein